MPLARCQAVADTRHEIVEMKFYLRHKLQNKQKETEIWTIAFKKDFKPEILEYCRKEDSSVSYWLEVAILTFLTFVALAGNPALLLSMIRVNTNLGYKAVFFFENLIMAQYDTGL